MSAGRPTPGGASSGRTFYILFNSDSIADIEEGSRVYRPGGFHPVYVGDIYNGKYEVMSKIGYGKHATLWLIKDLSFSEESNDRNRDKYYALKVLSAECYHTDNPRLEREVLKHLRSHNPGHRGYKHICHLLDDFEHEGPNGTHVCLVFELMGKTLPIDPTNFPGGNIPREFMDKFVEQMLKSLDYAHTSGVIHTSMNPEHIFVKIKNKGLIESQYLPKLSLPTQDKSKRYIPIHSAPLKDPYFIDDDNLGTFEAVLGCWGAAHWSNSR